MTAANRLKKNLKLIFIYVPTRSIRHLYLRIYEKDLLTVISDGHTDIYTKKLILIFMNVPTRSKRHQYLRIYKKDLLTVISDGHIYEKTDTHLHIRTHEVKKTPIPPHL